MRAAIEHYLLDLENTQPRNTRRSYLPKQEEWKVSLRPESRPRPLRVDSRDNRLAAVVPRQLACDPPSLAGPGVPGPTATG